MVKAVPPFKYDAEALLGLIKPGKPPLKCVRAQAIAKVYYGFRNASGYGLGATIQIGDKIVYEYGQWTSEVTETKLSNWRELNNLMEALKRVVKTHDLEGSESIFTNNTTAEAAFWKGTSTLKNLFELVFQLKKFELACGLILHRVHT
jgi:hypothetical protein